jgi:hypothetical protein
MIQVISVKVLFGIESDSLKIVAINPGSREKGSGGGSVANPIHLYRIMIL